MYNDEVVNIYNTKKLHENFLCEMATIDHRDSGLPYDLWLDPPGRTRGNEHTYTPRLKVELENGDMVPFLISDDPDIPESVKKTGTNNFKHIQAIKEYIKAYKEILLAHFNKSITDRQVLPLLNKLKDTPKMIEELNKILYPYKVEYNWDDFSNEYIINVLDGNGEVIETTTASHDFQLINNLNNLKDRYNIAIN